MKSVTCPVSCGKCCGDCSDLGPDGCRLPRDTRPRACLSFTCEVCDDVICGKMTRKEGLEILPEKWGF